MSDPIEIPNEARAAFEDSIHTLGLLVTPNEIALKLLALDVRRAGWYEITLPSVNGPIIMRVWLKPGPKPERHGHPLTVTFDDQTISGTDSTPVDLDE